MTDRQLLATLAERPVDEASQRWFLVMTAEPTRRTRRSRRVRHDGGTMHARRPRLTSLSIAGAVIAIAASGCGGGDDGSKKGESAKKADTSKEAAKILKQAFGANSKASSGQLLATIKISVTGNGRYRTPLMFTTEGPFDYGGGNHLVDTDLALELINHDLSLAAGAHMVVSGDNAYVTLGSTSYAIPGGITSQLRRNAVGVRNPVIRSTAPFGIRIDQWVKRAQVAGAAKLDGVDTVHLTGDIKPGPVFVDASRFTRLLKQLEVTSVADIPNAIGPSARAALLRSVTTATGELFVGKADHVLRKAHMRMELKASARDRKLLGIKTAKIDATLTVTQVGKPQSVKVQSDRGNYQEMIELIKTAAFANRSSDQRGK
jgi:hypothetical protein